MAPHPCSLNLATTPVAAGPAGRPAGRGIRGLLGQGRFFALLAALAGVPGISPARGAGDGQAPHWAFQPVGKPVPPAVADASWCRTPVDRFILAKLEAAGHRPEPPASPEVFIRRATLDLTGLPPTADEVDAFVREVSAEPVPAPASGSAHARLIDRLLASPAYGEQWGRHWLDVVRYADTAGETADYPVPVAWRYRNYVIHAFNADKPYDEFLREQIAGDILAKSGPRERYAERVTATGFLAVSRRFGFDSENYHHLTIQDTIDTLGQSVLGLTLGCARCHSHKYDPVPMADYYALYGIFESTRYAFPGSEQKQRSRALVPLVPPEESQPRWRDFERRVAGLVRRMELGGMAAPSVVLRSLDELDGDFEMQAPAAGGSRGVLVPPWVCEGPIAVTTGAQSPFRNLHPLGKVGVEVAAGAHAYRLMQAVPFFRRPDAGGGDRRAVPDTLHASVDFRISATGPAQSPHRFWLAGPDGRPIVEVRVTGNGAALKLRESEQPLGDLRPDEWCQLRLTLDLVQGTFSGSLARPDGAVTFDRQPLRGGWAAGVAAFGMDSDGADPRPHAAIALDNFAVQSEPIPPVSTGLGAVAGTDGPDAGALAAELQQLAGIDGDFELQTDGAAPATPWGPGPDSVVKVSAAAQSPFRNVFPAGSLGVQLPAGAAYNGFGQTLTPRWQADRTPRLWIGFDFRVGDPPPGADGSWRFYAGHGPGPSPAVELFFNGREFFRRSGDARDAVQPLRPGEWYQVRLELDLKARSYAGTLSSATGRAEFSGQFASNWDGSLDYTFIDSYGHLGGAKPSLDADNFVFRETPLPAPGAVAAVAAGEDGGTRRNRIAAVRERIAALKRGAEDARRELEPLLADGPFGLAYAVTEGTPRDARLQRRGEPDQPGEEVRRGFLQVLGGGPLPGGTAGSGRLELAEWIAGPENPLTARVLVNRVWQHHFGQALVGTPNDFGLRGRRPSHPELLDHLAGEFIRGGWSVKALHRLIMNSAVYRQRSRHSGVSDPASAGAGPDDCPVVPGMARSGGRTVDVPATDGFSPFNRRRLGAEELRDALLQVSGTLDPTPGEGHPFPSPTGWGYTQHGPFGAVYDHSRRSVYLMTQRIRRHPFLALFDGADPNASTAERRTTTVPTQALYFLNDPFVHASADRFAGRVLGAATAEADRVRAAYRLALGRNPLPSEVAEAAEFLGAYRRELAGLGRSDDEPAVWAAFARVLFGSNEFLTVD